MSRHVLRVNMVQTLGYNKTLVRIFIDYEKAFDTVNLHKKTLTECWIDHRYLTIIEYIWKNSALARLHADTKEFEIEKVVCKGVGINIGV